MTDRRVSGGLNNKGLPLRDVLRTVRESGGETVREGKGVAGPGVLHVLECGHKLPPVGTSYVRRRRCVECPSAGVTG